MGDELHDGGMTMKEAQAIFGHEDSSTTGKYIHVEEAQVRAAFEKVQRKKAKLHVA